MDSSKSQPRRAFGARLKEVGADSVVVAVLVGVFLVTVSRHTGFSVNVAITFGLFLMLAISLQLLLGFSNQASLAQAAVYGLGTYVSIFVETHFGVPPVVALLASIVAGALCGVIVALPLLRLREHFLAMGTLAFQVMLSTGFDHLNGLTGGVNGEVAPLAKLNSLSMLGLILGVDAVLVLGVRLFRQSSPGRRILAVKTDETMAMSLGVNVKAFRLAAVVVSFAIASAAGFFFSETAAFVAPDDFNLAVSLAVVASVIVGGKSLTWSALVGAGVYSILTGYTTNLPGLSVLILGVALIVILGYLPEGVTGVYSPAGEALAKLRLKRSAAESTSVSRIRSGQDDSVPAGGQLGLAQDQGSEQGSDKVSGKLSDKGSIGSVVGAKPTEGAQ